MSHITNTMLRLPELASPAEQARDPQQALIPQSLPSPPRPSKTGFALPYDPVRDLSGPASSQSNPAPASTSSHDQTEKKSRHGIPPLTIPVLLRTWGLARTRDACVACPLRRVALLFKGGSSPRDMETDWTTEERTAKRRLVECHPTRSGHRVWVKFNSVSADVVAKRPSSDVFVLSCIYWKERKEHFVTEQDAVALIGAVIGIEPTIEEGRSGYRRFMPYSPVIVCKKDGFRKLILGFPDPKPWIMKKTLRVFPWQVLELALGDIVIKYTASYCPLLAQPKPPTPEIAKKKRELSPDPPESSHRPTPGQALS